ncbi:hypothetical protein [Rhodoflexus sp.]
MALINACSFPKTADDAAFLPLADQNSSLCASCTSLLLPAQTKIDKINDNTVEIDLPDGYFFKAYLNDNDFAILQSSVTVSCSCDGTDNGRGCTPIVRMYTNGTIEYECKREAGCSSGCTMKTTTEKLNHIGDPQVQSLTDQHNRQKGYTKNKTLKVSKLEVGIGSPLDELKRIANIEFISSLDEITSQKVSVESLFPVLPASSFQQLMTLPPATEADVEAPAIAQDLTQMINGLKAAAEAQGIPVTAGKALVPLIIRGKVAYWQIPAAYVAADNSYGLSNIATGHTNFHCSGCNGGCVAHEKKTLEYTMIYCKGLGCDYALHMN